MRLLAVVHCRNQPRGTHGPPTTGDINGFSFVTLAGRAGGYGSPLIPMENVMHKQTLFMTFAAASLALSTSAVLVAQPAETPASDNAATPAVPATPATPADPSTDTAATPATPATPAVPAAKDPLAPDASATTAASAEADIKADTKDKASKKKAAKKPR